MPYQWLVATGGVVALAVAIYICRLAIRWRDSHRRTERELIAQRRQLDAALSNMSHGLSMFDANARLVLFNPRYTEMYQMPPELAKPGTSLHELVAYRARSEGTTTDPEGRANAVIASMRRGETRSDVVHAASGRSFQVTCQPMEGGGWVATHEDVTERLEREASFRLLFDGNPLPMAVFDLDTLRFLAVNQAAVMHYGYSREQFLAMTVLDVRPEADRPKFLAALPTFRGYYVTRGWRHRKADGSLFEIDAYSADMTYEGRRARISAIVDTTEQRRAERDRDRDRAFLDEIIDNVPVSIFVKDAVTRQFVLVNRAGEKVWNLPREQALGKTPHELFPADQADAITLHDDAVLQSNSALTLGDHVNLARPQDQRIVMSKRLAIRDENGKPRYVVTVVEDVTERKSIETQLQQSQKMEAVGSLTGGIAHDFNNLLTVIMVNLELLKDEVAGQASAVQKVDAVLQASQRGSELTRQLLAFSRRQPLQPKRIEVSALVDDTTRLLARTLGETVAVEVRHGSDLWPVHVDPAQLEASLVNIAINARDAMPHGGKLIIETHNTVLDQDYASRHADVMAGDHVCIEITDTGTGMPPDVLERIFEPFYTTKGPGKGTGLGLSMVYGFIRQSGGHIVAYSEAGKGTAFKLYLPRMIGAIDSSADIAKEAAPLGGAGETILVVDDNPEVRRAVVMQLRGLGYEVLEADGANSALAIIEDGRRIDLLLTDIVMPGINGKQLATLARGRQPELRILFTSGFPGAFAKQDSQLEPDDMLLSKPYRREDLARAVRETLTATAPPPRRTA